MVYKSHGVTTPAYPTTGLTTIMVYTSHGVTTPAYPTTGLTTIMVYTSHGVATPAYPTTGLTTIMVYTLHGVTTPAYPTTGLTTIVVYTSDGVTISAFFPTWCDNNNGLYITWRDNNNSLSTSQHDILLLPIWSVCCLPLAILSTSATFHFVVYRIYTGLPIIFQQSVRLVYASSFHNILSSSFSPLPPQYGFIFGLSFIARDVSLSQVLVFSYIASPQQGDLRLSGPPSGRNVSGGARTRDRKIPAYRRADSLATVSPTLPSLSQKKK
ncbi:hypothetical protein PoB_000966800 [Plakobranchus ocellatus]|uniref:Uncharacterized protein n=1 Tax=Plakobranchus ocellatus TaxID=259542 RepID=A0AAV3YKU7_9GAST|nr:hypothetical protein PoB_000966800 [Plakobranchus ocellatus]